MTNTSIVKTFMGTHLDLSKVVSISDAKFIDRMGSGGWFVGFTIEAQLMNQPIKYEREFRYSEYEFDGKHIMVYGKDGVTPLAVENLQVLIDQLVRQWKELT